jgi:exopolysaccharide biosynthesis WecB/TagA/CpsF family protein
VQSGPPSITILGVDVVRSTADAALREIERLADEHPPALVAYVNAHTLNLASADPSYKQLLNAADLVLNDGSGVGLAASVSGDRFPENLNGSDFNPRILELAARRGWPVYFLGAAPGVAAEAARRLAQRIERLVVAGTSDGYFERSEDGAKAAEIAASGAAVVMVAMGNPLQEKWLRDNLAATGARLGVGVGAFFDFSAENVRRAPAWMNRMGIEWVFRLLQEPRRLWRRYVVGNPVFLFRVLKDRTRR